MFEGLGKPRDLIVMVMTLLSYGCPVQAMVQACERDERTVATRRDRAGQHGPPVHEAIGEQGQLDLVPVQADEIRVKGRKMIAWGCRADGLETTVVSRNGPGEPRQGVG